MTPIVFDLDGTLIDSLPDIVVAANKMLADFGKPPLSEATIRGFIGNGLPVLVQRVRRASDLDEPGALDSILKHYNAAPSDLTRPYSGVLDALKALKGNGYPMGICTNKEYELTLPVLENLGLAPFFDVVVGGNSRPTRKPDGEPLLHCFQELGFSAGIFIGDSEVDAETGQNAGVPFGLFEGGYRKTPVEQLPHTFSFKDFADLPDLVERTVLSAKG